MLALACLFTAYIGAYYFNGQIKAKKIPHKNLNMQLTNTVESLSGQTKLAHSKKKLPKKLLHLLLQFPSSLQIISLLSHLTFRDIVEIQ